MTDFRIVRFQTEGVEVAKRWPDATNQLFVLGLELGVDTYWVSEGSSWTGIADVAVAVPPSEYAALRLLGIEFIVDREPSAEELLWIAGEDTERRPRDFVP